ncbi:hypothetical protein [Flavobacterium psychrophilum]|uniref:hypothetical protein n=3 Tax=Flavobacterium psychrophilum TaxID=96345 RepID=UPI000B7C2D2D|nr:hypothetical protein [Flavobacterium psychrophilum]SNB33812.1 conserved hypothetical protein [Flavobacterium psychrophilum]
MNYRDQENIKEIQNIIKPFKSIWEHQKDEQALESEINWKASILFSKLIIKAKLPESHWSKDKLEEFTTNYNSENNTKIDVKNLTNKFWIREIAGLIKIPNAITSITYDFEQKQSYKQELIFIRELYKYNNSKQEISKKDYSEYLKEYKKTNQLLLDETWLTKHWIISQKEEDENVKIGNIYYYFTLLDNWNEIKFLYSLKTKKSKQESKGLAISKKDFEDILTTHKPYFNNSPSIEELKEQQVIQEIGLQYYIHFYNSKIRYWDSLQDEICGQIWEDIIVDEKFTDDNERVKSFLSKILYWENNWPKFYKYISRSSKEIFLKTALQLVLKDDDIKGVNDEFLKCYLDDNIGARYAFQAGVDLSEDELKPSKDYYEFYKQMRFLSSKHQGNLFYVQENRNHLAFLINTIICCDKESLNIVDGENIETKHFPLIKELLKNGLEKPYLLWEVCHFLVQDKPTIIPYILIESEFSSLAFSLITKVKIESPIIEINESIKLKLYEKSIKLILDTKLSKADYSNSDVALLIFQLYKEINKDKFQSLSNVRTLDEQYKIRENHKKKESLLLSLIENCPINGYQVYTSSKEYLLPKIFPDIINLFKSHTEIEKYLNGTIQFSILKLDGLSWLSKCISYSKYENQFKNIEEIRENLSSIFITNYTEKLEQKTVSKKDFHSNKLITGLPSWSERNERLELIDWIYPMVVMKQTNQLQNLLTPKFPLKKADSEYDEENRFNAKKIRTHLYVLLTVLNRITSNKEDFFLIQNQLKDIKIVVEKQILVLLKQYAVVGKPSKIDILSSSFEHQLFGNSKKEELLPQVAQAINWFEDKNEIINVLISSSDLLRLLIILDWITSEGVKKEIIEKIKQTKIIDFFNSQSWLTEIELTLTKLSHYKDLVEQTKEALEYWEKKIIPKRKDQNDKQVSFAINLMLAYNEKDVNKINQLKEPKKNTFDVRDFKAYHHKQFFIGLINFERNPEIAYQIFDELYNQFKENSSICINRFAAKINWASKSENELTKNTLLKEALQEWKDAENNLPNAVIEEIKDKIWTNKLTVFYNLRDFTEFEKLYLELPIPYQMSEDVISMKIELLIMQEKQQEAIYLLQRSKEYHKASDGSNPDFINQLQSIIDDKSDIRLLKSTFLEIFSKKPKTLIQIFPEKLNGETEIGKFITKEFAIATNKALDKILAIDEIKNEDKYNDLVQMSLESRFSVFGWIVKDQSRGGFSESGKSSGERDIIIQDSNSEIITVCEAFIHRDFTRTESHLCKIFNYHHNRNNFIALIYDLDTYDKFDGKWNTYLSETVSKVKYPVSYEIDTTQTKDVTEEFDYKNSAIKIGKTTHGENTKIYHLMVNLKYKV